MKFSNTDRTLMAMLFQRGTVTEFNGKCTVDGIERTWIVRHIPANDLRRNEMYSGIITGIYGEIICEDTLVGCLDKIEQQINAA